MKIEPNPANKSRYDDLAQESWDSACDRMPQDYLDSVMAQINAVQPLKRRNPKTDAELDGSDELHAIEGKLMAKEYPRFGQPADDAPLVEWLHEFQFRTQHPLWIEKEYYYTPDGQEIHVKGADKLFN